MCSDLLCAEFWSGFITLATAICAALWGLHSFNRQKEYELVKQRYLDESIDLILGHLEEAGSIYLHNWQRTLQCLKSYRNLGGEFDIKEFERDFLILDTSQSLNTIAHHRLAHLIGVRFLWNAYQLALSSYFNANNQLRYEVKDCIKQRLNSNNNASKEENEIETDRIVQEMEESKNSTHKHAEFTANLVEISMQLEKSKMTFSEVNKFRQNDQVISALNAIEQLYGKDLEPYSG